MSDAWLRSMTVVTLIFVATFARAEAERSVLFQAGEDGYHTYRIPALITTREGAVLAFCEGRKHGRGDSGKIDLLVKRSEDSGKTWSPQQILWEDGENTCGNPCPVIDQQSGRIHLLLTWNLGSDQGRALHAGTSQETRRVFYSTSDDDGRSFTAPVEITAEAKDPHWKWYATGPGVGIQLTKGPRAGRLVIPCDHTVSEELFNSHALYSDDGGNSWKYSQPIGPGCNECQLVELSDGRLLMSMRSQEISGAPAQIRQRNGYRSISFSEDGGETWSAPVYDDELVDPVCQASLIRYNDQTLLYSSPDSPATPGRGKRIRMTIRASRDDGATWKAAKLIEPGPSAYSCLTRMPDGRIGLVFETGETGPYERIDLVLLDAADLVEQPVQEGGQ